MHRWSRWQRTEFDSATLDSLGRVWTWGLGRLPAVVSGMPASAAVFVMGDRYLATTPTGDAWTWQGTGTPARFSPLDGVVQATANPALLRMSDGRVLTGRSDIGFPDLHERTDLSGSVFVASAVSGTPAFALTVDADGHVTASGTNGGSRFGDGVAYKSVTPDRLLQPAVVRGADLGGFGTIATDEFGGVWVWGRYDNADGTHVDYPMPHLLAGLPPAAAVVQDGPDSYALLDDDGQLWTWGANLHGDLGDGTTNPRATPQPVAGLDDVVDVAGSAEGFLALTGDGRLLAWGSNADGSLGDGTTTNRRTPIVIASGIIAMDAASDGEWHAAVRVDGTVLTWGVDPRTNALQPTPTVVPGIDDAVDVSVGRNHALVLRGDGTVAALGQNTVGQLGTGDTAPQAGVVSVIAADGGSGALNDVVQVAADYTNSYAVRADGTLVAWGRNDAGQLGRTLGPAGSRAPLSVPRLQHVTTVDAGGGRVLALADPNLAPPDDLGEGPVTSSLPANGTNVDHGAEGDGATAPILPRRARPRRHARVDTVREQPSSRPPPTGYGMIGEEVLTTAPPATAVSPLRFGSARTQPSSRPPRPLAIERLPRRR